MYLSNTFSSCCWFLFWKTGSFMCRMKLLKIPFCVMQFNPPITQLCSWNENKYPAVVQHCRPPQSLAMEQITWSHSHTKITIKSPTQLKIVFDLHLKCQAIHNTYKFYVYVTNNMEIALRIHSSKNTAVMKIRWKNCNLWPAAPDPHLSHWCHKEK